MNHPAKEFGTWLKSKRQERRIVLRVFAGRIGMYPAEYAEVEAGIVRWLTADHEIAIQEVLALSENEFDSFHQLLEIARTAEPLEFSDVFTREQLAPVRTRNNGEQLSEASHAAILDAVFSPLK